MAAPRPSSPVRGWPSRWLDATGYGGTGPAGACHGISPVKSPNGSARSLLYASRVHWTRWLGCRFSAIEERPKKPVPTVIDGARPVSRPELPRLLPTLTATRSTSTAAPYSMITFGSRLWMAAEWPRPDSRSTARAASMPRRADGTRTRPSTGQSFSWASGSSGTTRSNGARSTRVVAGTLTPACAAIQVASLPTNRMSNRPPGNSSAETLSRSAGSSR